MPLITKLVWNTAPNPGVQVELLLEFLELVDLVPTDQDKVPSQINVEKVECLPLLTPGEDGIEKLTLSKDVMLLPLPSLLLLFSH